VNGDGYSDVLVTSPGESGAIFNSQGVAYLFLGSPAGLASSPSWEGHGESSVAAFGQAAGTAGDVNGDGYSDFVIGSGGTGNVFVYLGAANSIGPVHRTFATDPPGPNFRGRFGRHGRRRRW
jgi:hypothetical protein